MTPSDLNLAWAVHDPSLARFPWQLALTAAAALFGPAPAGGDAGD